MTLKKTINLLITAVIFAGASVVTQARCPDLRGTWQTYGYVTADGNATSEAYSCTFTTDSLGALEVGSGCATYLLSDGQPFANYPASGSFVAADDANGLCKITGELLIGQVPLTIIEATMNRAGDEIHGIDLFGLYGTGAKTMSYYRID